MNDIDLSVYESAVQAPPTVANASIVDTHQVKNEQVSTSFSRPQSASPSKPSVSSSSTMTPNKSNVNMLKRLRSPSPTSYGQAADTYDSSTFGGFGDYMRRKRAKLQIQNIENNNTLKDAKPPIFKGLAIYVSFTFFPFGLFVIERTCPSDQWIYQALCSSVARTYRRVWRNIPRLSGPQEDDVRVLDHSHPHTALPFLQNAYHRDRAHTSKV